MGVLVWTFKLMLRNLAGSYGARPLLVRCQIFKSVMLQNPDDNCEAIF